MASKIMTNDRSGKKMGDTCMTYCENWILSQPEFYNRDISTFYSDVTTKGNAVERDSLDFIGVMLYDGAFFEPNKIHFNNDNYKTGTPDQILEDHLFDNKGAWSAKTFPLFEKQPKKDYWWQGQVYMNLTGRKKYKVIHTLMNTPEPLIKSEAYRAAKDLGYSEPTDEIYADCEKRLTFNDVPDHLRIKVFEFDYDHQSILDLEKRVEECREYIFNLLLEL